MDGPSSALVGLVKLRFRVSRGAESNSVPVKAPARPTGEVIPAVLA